MEISLLADSCCLESEGTNKAAAVINERLDTVFELRTHGAYLRGRWCHNWWYKYCEWSVSRHQSALSLREGPRSLLVANGSQQHPTNMNTKITILLACIGLVVCQPVENKASDLEPQETAGVIVSYHGNAVGRSAGHSVGSGLVSIAQGAVDQAHRAIASQATVGAQASFQAQAGLAQTAIAAATTAQAALAGKQAIVTILEQQVRDAQAQLEAENLQLTQAHRAATAAQQAAEQSQLIQNALTAALNAAQTGGDQAQRAAQEASSEFASQSSMVASARQRLALSEDQLGDARADLEATQAAALKAEGAAQAAIANASKQSSSGGHTVAVEHGYHY
ncbi:uncharacterized protein [Anabrus simplex]|uniref:uncharacterized protein n=1 Tax=Anabrus simplex TaxID=316456 RepID=UPI0035A358C0